MNSYKSILKNSTIYTILGFLPTAVNFFMVPLLTSYLTKEEYGLLSVSTIFQGLISIFLNVGLDAAFARFYFNIYKKKKLLHAYFSTILVSILISSAFFFFIFFFAGEQVLRLIFTNNLFHFGDYGIISFFLAVSTILFTIIQTFFRNEENIRSYAIISISMLVLTISGVLFGVVYMKGGAYGNICGRLFACSSIVAIYLLLYFRKQRFIFKFTYLKKMLKYGFPFVPYLLLLMANSSIDQWMTERYFSLTELGAFNFTFQLASLISVFIYSVFNAISPRIFKLLSENKDEHNYEIQKLLSIFHLLVVFAISVELAFINPLIELIIPNKSYFSMLIYMPLLMLFWLVHLYYMIYVIPLMYYNKTRFLPLIMLISLSVGITCSMSLIPILGFIGVIISSLVIKSTSFTGALFFSKRLKILNPVQYRIRRNHGLALIIGISLVVSFILSVYDHKNMNFYNVIPMSLFVVLTILLFKKELSLVKKNKLI